MSKVAIYSNFTANDEKQASSDVIQAFQAGLITREQALAELKARGEDLGVYTKIEPEGDPSGFSC